MSEIAGLEGMSEEDLEIELENGAKFVVNSYCSSVIILTFKQPSAIHFVRSNESRFVKGLPYTLISLITGWWGIHAGCPIPPPMDPILAFLCKASTTAG